MNMIVHKDLAQVGGTNLSLNGGYDVERIFLVEHAPGNPDAIVYNAIRHGDVPKPGDRHPTIPLIVVHSVNGKSIGSQQVEVSITYKALSGASTTPDEEGQTQISIGATVQSVRTNKEFVKGTGGKFVENQMLLKYIYPDGKDPNGKPNGFENEVVPEIEKQAPVVTATLSRTETEDPAQKARDFVGKINSKVFIGSIAGSWMCTSISGSSNDSGATYQVSYQFMYAVPSKDVSGRPQPGWRRDVFFTDETGNIPPDAKDQDGAHLSVWVQEFADFTLLNLGPFSTSGVRV